MAKDEFEIIPMGKSPVHEAVEWLAMYEFLCKQVAAAFGVPPELLMPSNTASTRLGGTVTKNSNGDQPPSG